MSFIDWATADESESVDSLARSGEDTPALSDNPVDLAPCRFKGPGPQPPAGPDVLPKHSYTDNGAIQDTKPKGAFTSHCAAETQLLNNPFVDIMDWSSDESLTGSPPAPAKSGNFSQLWAMPQLVVPPAPVSHATQPPFQFAPSTPVKALEAPNTLRRPDRGARPPPVSPALMDAGDLHFINDTPAYFNFPATRASPLRSRDLRNGGFPTAAGATDQYLPARYSSSGATSVFPSSSSFLSAASPSLANPTTCGGWNASDMVHHFSPSPVSPTAVAGVQRQYPARSLTWASALPPAPLLPPAPPMNVAATAMARDMALPLTPVPLARGARRLFVPSMQQSDQPTSRPSGAVVGGNDAASTAASAAVAIASAGPFGAAASSDGRVATASAATATTSLHNDLQLLCEAMSIAQARRGSVGGGA